MTDLSQSKRALLLIHLRRCKDLILALDTALESARATADSFRADVSQLETDLLTHGEASCPH